MLSNSRQRIIEALQRRDSLQDNIRWIFVGIDPDKATQLFNSDGSIPYVRQEGVPKEALAMSANIDLVAELYKITWISDEAPDSNEVYWLSLDQGVNKVRLDFVRRESRAEAAYWWIYLKKA